ncbi:MAG: AAA family ATPase, partial [Desulfopila sp.]
MIEPRLRYIAKAVAQDLAERMVFVGGPRQVGKTTFALSFLPESREDHIGYLNWDDPKVRPMLLKGELPAGERCLV